MKQTFIRNAVGKALTDSPALNQKSRQVMAPMPRQLPPALVDVPGPDPAPPRPAAPRPPVPVPAAEYAAKPPPLVSNDSEASANSGEVTHPNEDEAAEEGEDMDDVEPSSPASGRGPSDPYAELGSAFGGYLADQPQPIGRSGTIDETDALF